MKGRIIHLIDLQKQLLYIGGKIYAKSHSVSLSKLIENYLNSLTQKSKEKSSVSALVESLTGIIPNDYDEIDDYRNYIDKKSS